MMRRNNLTWGGILVLLGILFLLDNLDIINFNIWQFFWPLLLIWLGIQILLASRGRGGAATTEHVTIPIKGIEEAHFRINFGAGELHIHGNTAPDELLDGSFGTGVNCDLKEDGEVVDVKLSPPSNSFFLWPMWGTFDNRNWSFGLNSDIPLSLDVNTGASKSVLNLADLNLKKIRLQTGASESDVTLPAHAAFTEMRAETGMAAVNVHVPEGVAARIHTSGGLSDIKVDQNRFPRTGDKYESADYGTAENKVDIHITVGLGSANIQ